jgi:hypothetical protein
MNQKIIYNESLEKAVTVVSVGQMTLGEASRYFDVKKTTLHDRLSGKHGPKSGPPTVLSQTTESLIVDLLELLSDIGYCLTRIEVIEVVSNYLIETNQTHLFKHSKPTKDWYYSFMKRHHDRLAIKNSNNMPSNRK